MATKREILETENMLDRLAGVLDAHVAPGTPVNGQARADAESLRKISMTLHRWHELECGTDRGCIERDEKTNKPYWLNAHSGKRGAQLADREAGALRRLARIMKNYPALSAYVQTDPRGCALYILRPGDVPAGEKAESYYSRGVAVHK